MINFYIGSEEDLLKIDAAISATCEWPNSKGTLRWAIPQKAYNQDFWFLSKPPEKGYNLGEFTQAQMIANVDITNITELEWNKDWFPPAEDE